MDVFFRSLLQFGRIYRDGLVVGKTSSATAFV